MLDPHEVIELSDEALSLGREIARSLDPKGAGGRKITRQEGKALLSAAGRLILVLIRDVLD